MSAGNSGCEQAIFTSIRTPMGEGYRIVAASSGLRQDEKQTITRFSPSHHGLCGDDDPADSQSETPQGVAFYPLPSGRLCVALSYLAGAEHTGRGGQRVYTHNVVLSPEDFPFWGYNPFNVIRAMIAAGLTTPQLKPPPVLPELDLSSHQSPDGEREAAFHETLTTPCTRRVLQKLLDQEKVMVSVDGRRERTAEALILGIPGSLRANLSLAAGLRFSTTRSHQLTLLSDPKGVTKSRIAGQPIEYVDPRTNVASPLVGDVRMAAPASSWLVFVERHWNRHDFGGLARRTSRSFVDPGRAGRELVGRLYNCIDDIPQMRTPKLLSTASLYLASGDHKREPDILGELLDRASHTLQQRFVTTAWSESKTHWPILVQLCTVSKKAAAFAAPIVDRALRTAATADPLDAAEAALDIVRTELPALPKSSNTDTYSDVIEKVLTRLADWAERAPTESLERLFQVYERWRAVGPQSSAFQLLATRCKALRVGTAAGSPPGTHTAQPAA